jgi:hypothetical protein
VPTGWKCAIKNHPYSKTWEVSMTWHVIYIEGRNLEFGSGKLECGHRPVGEIGAYAPEGSGKWEFGIGKWEFGIG